MRVGLETSVALRLLTGVPAEQTEKARKFIASAESPVVISDLVVSETYFALRHHFVVAHGDAVRALHSLVEDPRIECDGIAEAVLRDVSALRANAALRPGLMDRLIQADYASSGVDLVTFDRDLARLPGTRQL